jgi:hypothetical protein
MDYAASDRIKIGHLQKVAWDTSFNYRHKFKILLRCSARGRANYFQKFPKKPVFSSFLTKKIKKKYFFFGSTKPFPVFARTTCQNEVLRLPL